METLFAAPCKLGTIAMAQGRPSDKAITDQTVILVATDSRSVAMVASPMLNLH